MSYMTISSQEKHNFSLCSCFHAHPTTLLLKILGDQCMGGPPPQILGGDRPPQSPQVSAPDYGPTLLSPCEIEVGLHQGPRAVETHLKKLRFLGFFKKPKKPKNLNLFLKNLRVLPDLAYAVEP